jgi:hypothetical protein
MQSQSCIETKFPHNEVYLCTTGFEAFTHDNDNMRGWTEGFTMLLIAVQTDVLDLKPLQRAFLMSILLFIVASSLIQSMYELADPVLLALSASHNKSVFKVNKFFTHIFSAENVLNATCLLIQTHIHLLICITRLS